MAWIRRHARGAGYAAGIASPAALTAILSAVPAARSRDYVFLYLAVVAVLGVAAGLGPALVAAATSFLLVDYFFVPPLHTLTIADETDIANLLVFFGVAGLVGTFGSRRRAGQLRAEALAADLRRANIELERLNREQAEAAAVAVRLAQTQQQVRVLEEEDRVRRELLANVSHELRTPLGAILTGATGQAQRDDLPEDARRELRTVADEATRLSRLVQDMLDLARLDAHALDLELTEIDLGDAITAAAERLRLNRPRREVKVELADAGIEVVADWDRLGQVLDNLLSNADRHAPAGTAITVRAVRGKRSMAVVTVADQGAGVSPELRPHIFERFVHDDAAGGGSTGLGLPIARGLVEAHAGRLWLEEAEPGHGARFAFTLPLALDEGAARV